MVGTETEDVYLNELPSGFNTTFLDSDRLRELTGTSTDDIDEVVEDYGEFTLTERQLIRQHADKINSAFTLPERTIELPGLQLALDPSIMPGDSSLLELFASKYKKDNSTPSGTIKTPARAKTEDIVFTVATPEVFNQINDNGGSVSNFTRTGLSAGNTEEIVGQGGIDNGVNTAGNSLTLDDDEYLFFTGDFIDLSDGRSVLTKFAYPDIDGEDYGQIQTLHRGRLSGLHLMLAQGTYITSSVDIDAKVYEAGDTEIVPVAFYMADGSKTPALVSGGGGV